MSSDFIRKKIHDYLISLGLDELSSLEAADKGIEFFNRGNLKDPYSESLRHAGVYAESRKEGFKFKMPGKVTGKPFSYSKPKSRKHNKQNNSLID